MSETPSTDTAGNGREHLTSRVDARRRADLVSGLRRLSKPQAPAQNGRSIPTPGVAEPGAELIEHCDLCRKVLAPDHRHLLRLSEREILCACESCVALRSGDPDLRPTGTRIVWLEDFDLSDEMWASFQIPIGLAFFMDSTTAGGIVAFYPSPGGSMESELDLDAWARLRRANPVLASLEADGEALLVNRVTDPPQQAIVPIDECYKLVGLIKAGWEGISGGAGPEEAIAAFFADLRERGESP